MVTHYSYEVFEGALSKSPCGAYSDRHAYSERVHDVDCRKCLKALGYEETAE
jgi:hypothetical protein